VGLGEELQKGQKVLSKFCLCINPLLRLMILEMQHGASLSRIRWCSLNKEHITFLTGISSQSNNHDVIIVTHSHYPPRYYLKQYAAYLLWFTNWD